jgi:hypothetical protein
MCAMVSTILVPMLWLATAGAAPTPASGKLPSDVGKEMAEAVVALDKALGLESWPMHGDKPCIDRGGLGATARDVTVEETRNCAASAIATGFPALGKSYGLAVLMASIGPMTVVALGTGEAAGWGAYSCDPGRKCLPTKLTPANKWGKRMLERQTKACTDPTTIWFPPAQKVCPPSAAPAPAPKK